MEPNATFLRAFHNALKIREAVGTTLRDNIALVSSPTVRSFYSQTLEALTKENNDLLREVHFRFESLLSKRTSSSSSTNTPSQQNASRSKENQLNNPFLTVLLNLWQHSYTYKELFNYKIPATRCWLRQQSIAGCYFIVSINPLLATVKGCTIHTLLFFRET